jgi:hypothetical protein
VNSLRISLATIALLATCAHAQTLHPAPRHIASAIAAQTFDDPTYKLSFDYPANWTFSHTDGEISTFHYDARTAPRRAILRALVAIPENPFPASTFSGAYVYYSVTPHISAASCADQAVAPRGKDRKPPAKPTLTQINDIPFTHGHDEVKDICITQRDEVYTTRHLGSCYRFDLSINNFCGGDVSSVKYISPSELDQVRARLESILNTIHFDPQ